MLLQREVPLAPLTTLGLGGRAARMAIVGDEADLVAALQEAEGSGTRSSCWAEGATS